MSEASDGFEEVEELEAEVEGGKAKAEFEIPEEDGLGEYTFEASVEGEEMEGATPDEPMKVAKDEFSVVVRPSSDESPDDEVTLERDDGAWDQTKAMSEAEDRDGDKVLTFEGVPFSSRPDQTFTATVSRGGEEFPLFEGVQLERPE